MARVRVVPSPSSLRRIDAGIVYTSACYHRQRQHPNNARSRLAAALRLRRQHREAVLVIIIARRAASLRPP